MNVEIRPCRCGKSRSKDWHLACPDCWALVPTALQEEVYRLYKEARGSVAHVVAVRRCYEAIRAARTAKKEGGRP